MNKSNKIILESDLAKPSKAADVPTACYRLSRNVSRYILRTLTLVLGVRGCLLLALFSSHAAMQTQNNAHVHRCRMVV